MSLDAFNLILFLNKDIRLSFSSGVGIEFESNLILFLNKDIRLSFSSGVGIEFESRGTPQKNEVFCFN